MTGSRRKTIAVKIGSVSIGGGNPVAVQTMTDCSTMDTGACVDQIRRIASAGCRIVRLTTQGLREAANLGAIRARLRDGGIDVALVADVHFSPAVAMAAADHADKVRINPGNYGSDPARFEELVEKCRARGVALRIGVNHGSLAPHVVERLGDTPRGMVASAMELLKVCRKMKFDQVVVSMKSSNVRTMVHAYRLLAAEMYREGMEYPLHLGVTEAGDGMEGKIKSAVGIATLLAEGLGDTIRVSLAEPPWAEIPVADRIVSYMAGRGRYDPAGLRKKYPLYDPFDYRRRGTEPIGNIGGRGIPLLFGELDGEAREAVDAGRVAVLEGDPARWRDTIPAMDEAGDRRPVVLKKHYDMADPGAMWVAMAADMGPALVDGLADALWVGEGQDDAALAVMQAARARFSKTEYIACPGCGRTLFDLRETLARVKERTAHLRGLKIGVMGCIVNGPGEMADADYGYVGEGGGRVTLYKGRQVVRRSVPGSEAVDALVELIKENGDWRDH